MYAYVGSRTTRERNARGDGITVFRVSPAGALETVQVCGDLVNPSFLALNRNGDRLYTVHGDGDSLSVFAIDRLTGRIEFLQQQSCGGRNPVHLALDPTGQFMVVSNHLGGCVVILPIRDDGTLGPVSQRVELPGEPGPHRVEQAFSKPHFNPFDPSGRWVVVPDKGLDRIFVFGFGSGQLQPAAVPCVQTRAGAGPRHVAFHPTAPLVYVVNELDSSVTAYRFDAASGALAAFQWLPALPDDFTGNSRASGITVDESGKTLYASNRGHDSIAVFAIDEATGHLRMIQSQPSLGRTPRYFALAPGGRWLYVLNEESGSIVTFAADAATGRLSPSGSQIRSRSPVCMIFSQ
jgi:6-phosphogluconolactonase (cycloisomerase 2 family)